MSEKIYVISCSRELLSMGMDRVRTAVEGMDERTLSLDWSKVRFAPIVARWTISICANQSNKNPGQFGTHSIFLWC